MARPAELHVGPVIAVGDLAAMRDFYEGISVTDGMQVAWVSDPDGSVLTFFELTS